MRLFRSVGGAVAGPRLEGRQVFLRSPVERDWRAYADLRTASRAFLEPWEPTWPADALTRDAFQRRLARYEADWRDDAGYSFLVFRREDATMVGGITMSNVRRGVAQDGTLGYWVGEAHAQRGYMTDALLLVVDFSFDHLALHRLEAACLPSNEASQRLLVRCGFAREGFARRYLKIRGEWRDHLLFALLEDDPRQVRPTAASLTRTTV
ncbi:MAG: N-acetyltransferase [Alphaproteobacteria bacterium]|nr:N-acetyltransferase [Alphaproteobacteria bacterium]